jgi:hypothetical protein
MFRKHVRGGVNIEITREINNIDELKDELEEFKGASMNSEYTVLYTFRAFNNPTLHQQYPMLPREEDLYFITSEATSRKAERIMSFYLIQGCYIKDNVLHVAQLAQNPSVNNTRITSYDFVRDIATYTFNEDGTITQQVGDSEIPGKLVLGKKIIKTTK